jgi:selenoprotein W-related protein
LFDRKEAAHFPEIKELKQMIRDIVNPGKDLGHSDKK